MGHIAPLDPRLAAIPVGRTEARLRQRLATVLLETGANRQCVSLAKAAAGDFRSVREWRRGPNVFSQRFAPGTPIATFLDREGNDSVLYDGGVGVGAPGNMTSHAAVLVAYIDGSDGLPAGILVLDQHALLDDIRRMIYHVDPTQFGTGNALNYYLIEDRTGIPLGRAATPGPTRAASSEENAVATAY